MNALANSPSYCRAKGLVNRADADWLDALTVAALALAPLFFLTVRGWTNGFLVVLLIIAICGIWRRPHDYRPLLADMRLRWMIAALVSAVLAIACSQILRTDIEPPAYDGPLRLLAACPLLIFLTRRRIDFTQLFQWICPAAMFATAILLVLSGQQLEKWNGRWSTYFVDPLTLGEYTLLFAFFCLFSIGIAGRDSVWAVVYKVAGAVVGFVISIGAGSRSGWIALPVLFVLWLTVRLRIRNVLQLTGGFLLLAVVCLLLYALSTFVHHRVDTALGNLQLYFGGGNKDTSLGLRLSLWRACWQLFLSSPLYGYGDVHIPSLASFPSIAPYDTYWLQYTLTHNGAHNELMQNLVRSGVFGLISTVLLFAVPAVIFFRAALSENETERAAAGLGLCYIAALFCFGIGTEALNLKYLASFYGLMVAQATAQVVWASAPTVAAEMR